MTASTTTGGAPLVVGLGGTLRANSSTERALRYCLESVERQGGRTRFFSGPDLDLPIEDLREDPRVYLDNTPWGCISCAYGWQAAVGTLEQLRSIGHALRAWPTPLGVAINSADKIWDADGTLTDTAVCDQLDMLASQVLTFARAAWETT
jgi:FMN reductase